MTCRRFHLAFFALVIFAPAHSLFADAMLLLDNRQVHVEAKRSFTTFYYWNETATPVTPFANFDAAFAKDNSRGVEPRYIVRGSATQDSEILPTRLTGNGTASAESFATFGIPIGDSFSTSIFDLWLNLSTPHFYDLTAGLTAFWDRFTSGAFANASVEFADASVRAGTAYGGTSGSLQKSGLLAPGSYRFLAFTQAKSVGNRLEDHPVVDDNSASASFSFDLRLTDAATVPEATSTLFFLAIGMVVLIPLAQRTRRQ